MTNQEKKSVLLTKLAILEGLVGDLGLLSGCDSNTRELADRALYFSKCDVELFDGDSEFQAKFKEIVERIEGDIEALLILTQNSRNND